MVAGVIKRLEDHPFFADWTRGELSVLGEASEIRVFSKGQVIIEEGGLDYGVYFILEGEVSIMPRIDGVFVEVDTRGPGELFGEIALLTQEPCIARVAARTPCVTSFLPQKAINDYFGSVPPLLSRLLHSLVRHVGKTSVGFAERTIHHEKMAMVGSVVNDVVNDFKSPVQMISLGVEAIDKLSRDKQVKKICSTITEQVTKLLELTSELAVFAHNEAHMKYVRTNLRSFIADFREREKGLFSNPSFLINMDVPDIDLDIEPVGMTKALHNLLHYCAYAPNMRNAHVSLVATADDGWVEISLSDDCKCVPDNVIHSFWEPFTTTEMGLSMSVVKGVVESHGGIVSLESPAGEGTTFVMRIPRFHVTGS
jgi:signal transduction histidine kinase